MKKDQKFFGVIGLYPHFSAYLIGGKIKRFFLAIFVLIAALYIYNKYVALYFVYYSALIISLISTLVKLFFFVIGIVANMQNNHRKPKMWRSMALDKFFDLNKNKKASHHVANAPRDDEGLANASHDDDELPVYTILLPVRQESEILPQLVSNIDELDYPKDKLDILLLVEEDDAETINFLNSFNLPKQFQKIIIPHSFPKTKPKACNYGLSRARGEFVTIYDAEDVPDKLQLKKAVAKFHALPAEYICLQACLLPYNHDSSIIAGCATLEYSMWFEFILKALDLLGFPILLGGSSNHFKRKKLDEIGGWDDFNVTEDADIGIRLARLGYKSTMLDSMTYEEVPVNFVQFIKQRSRWIKGHFKTYLTHQNPRLPAPCRKTSFLCNYFLGLTIFGFIARLVLFSGFLLVKNNYLAMILLSQEYGLNLIILFSVCSKRKWKNLWPSILMFHHYFILHSIAAVIACYELICKPYYWSKTEHGLRKLQKETKFQVETDF